MLASFCIHVKVNGSSYSRRDYPANRPRLISYTDWCLGFLWICFRALAKGKWFSLLLWNLIEELHVVLFAAHFSFKIFMLRADPSHSALH